MNSLVFWPVMAAVVISDVITKAIAVAVLSPSGVPRPVIGDFLRWTLVYNPGAAFGFYLGQYSRWIFLVLTVVLLGILWRMYKETEQGDYLKTLAISLVSAGGIGNLIDRIRHEYGVVDFIDVGIGASRWPTFNVADMGVSVGAIILAWTLWKQDSDVVGNSSEKTA